MLIKDIITNTQFGNIIESCMMAFAVVSVFIEITPIKINPWSWLAKKIGRAINSEVLAKVDELERDISEMRKEEDERNAKAARIRILHFGDELLHSPEQLHSKEHFDEILQSITEYNQYCAEHPNFKNNMTEATTKHILHIYEKCLEEHSFL